MLLKYRECGEVYVSCQVSQSLQLALYSKIVCLLVYVLERVAHQM